MLAPSSQPRPASPAMRIIDIKVKPGSRVSWLTPTDDGPWLAQVKAPPVDGKANAEVITLVAEHFGLRKAQVTIRTGTSGRLKRVQIDD